MSRSVLVVDATATNRIALKAALSAARYRVRTATSGAEAESLVAREGPDLMLVDSVLPDMTGAELCRRVVQTDAARTGPIVILTDTPEKHMRVDALKAGAATLLARPLERSWLLTNIRALLRAHETRVELERRDATAARLGFAEVGRAIDMPARIAVVTATREAGVRTTRALRPHLPHDLVQFDPERAITLEPGLQPELFVLGQDLDIEETLWLLSELRARPETRRAAVLVEFDPGQQLRGARALDLGANDVIEARSAAEEKAFRIARSLSLKRATDRLRATVDAGLAMAVRDPLTGLYNRHYAMHHIAELAAKPCRHGADFGLLMLDLDHFKLVNDTHGHAAGDAVLRTVAECLRQNLRESDLIARIGGEEFLVALSRTDRTDALAAAERLRTAVAALNIHLPGGAAIGITCSIGLALADARTRSADALIAQADAALYAAKGDGRNRAAFGPSMAAMPGLPVPAAHSSALGH